VSTMTKVFVVLTSVVAIVLSCLTVATAARWSNLKDQIDSYQQLYQAELVKRMNLEGIMAVSLAMKDDALKEKDRLLARQEEEVRRVTADLAAKTLDLARETNDRVAAEAGRKKLEEILQVQTEEVTASRKYQQQLLADNIDLQTRNQRLASRVLELTSQTTILTDELRNAQEKLYAAEQKVKELQQSLAADTRRPVVEKEAPSGVVPVAKQVAGPIRGEIVELDGRYVSLNVGETSGVVPGMTFMVYRGATYVGDVQVEMVRPRESGGKITMVATGQAVQRGDQVIYGLE